MITCSDIEYKSTKLIKQGKRHLAPLFAELAQWISSTRNTNVLNIVYDTVSPDDRPRLQIILELDSEMKKFREGEFGNFNQNEQKAISARFKELLTYHKISGYNTVKLFVVFSAFSRLAKEDADSKITETQITDLKRRIGNPELWEISRCFGSVTFLFFTDAQAKKSDKDGLRKTYAERYFQMLKPHDEFGYLSATEYHVFFDSKENFDKNYESNWYYYYK
jgi:hypothetical protein